MYVNGFDNVCVCVCVIITKGEANSKPRRTAGPARVYTTATSVTLLNDTVELDSEGRGHFSLTFDKGGVSFQIHRVYFKVNVTPPGNTSSRFLFLPFFSFSITMSYTPL